MLRFLGRVVSIIKVILWTEVWGHQSRKLTDIGNSLLMRHQGDRHCPPISIGMFITAKQRRQHHCDS